MALGPKDSHLLVCVSACVNKILGNTLLCSSCRIFELRWKNSLLRKKAAVEKLIETSVPELYQQLVLTNRPTIQLKCKNLWMLSACRIELWYLTNMCMISIRKIKQTGICCKEELFWLIAVIFCSEFYSILCLGLAIQALRGEKQNAMHLQEPGNVVLLSCSLGRLCEFVINKLKQLSSNNVRNSVIKYFL